MIPSQCFMVKSPLMVKSVKHLHVFSWLNSLSFQDEFSICHGPNPQKLLHLRSPAMPWWPPFSRWESWAVCWVPCREPWQILVLRHWFPFDSHDFPMNFHSHYSESWMCYEIIKFVLHRWLFDSRDLVFWNFQTNVLSFGNGILDAS